MTEKECIVYVHMGKCEVFVVLRFTLLISSSNDELLLLLLLLLLPFDYY